MDYFIIAVTTISGLCFHWWLYVRIKRWMDRDFALSLVSKEPEQQAYILKQLELAKQQKIPRKALNQWLTQAAQQAPTIPNEKGQS